MDIKPWIDLAKKHKTHYAHHTEEGDALPMLCAVRDGENILHVISPAMHPDYIFKAAYVCKMGLEMDMMVVICDMKQRGGSEQMTCHLLDFINANQKVVTIPYVCQRKDVPYSPNSPRTVTMKWEEPCRVLGLGGPIAEILKTLMKAPPISENVMLQEFAQAKGLSKTQQIFEHGKQTAKLLQKQGFLVVAKKEIVEEKASKDFWSLLKGAK